MVGALVGIKKIPKDMYQHVLNFDCEKVLETDRLGRKRPNFLNMK
jgi:hypothetical protein